MAVKAVESLRRGLHILEAFSAARPQQKLSEITRKTGLPKPTVYRLLQTLVGLDFVKYDPEETTYRLGPKVMSLGFAVLSGLDVREAAQPYLEQLSRELDQNVNLGVLDGGEVIYVTRIKRRRILNIDLHVGSRLGLHNTSIGRAILAWLDEPDRERIIAELLADPAKEAVIGPGAERLRAMLARVRAQGYAICDEEFAVGLRAAGAPVFNARGEVEAAINVAVFSPMCSRADLESRITPRLLDVAAQVSRIRGYPG
jgi:IclR family pca regulon transcriptional regulator